MAKKSQTKRIGTVVAKGSITKGSRPKTQKGTADWLMPNMDFNAEKSNRSRITGHFSLSYENFQDDPKGIHRRFDSLTDGQEQPYERDETVGDKWMELDVGWIKKVGLGTLVLVNLGSGRRFTKPTPEEVEEEAAKIVEIAIGTKNNKMPFTIPLNRPQPFWMEEDAPIFLRCRSGIAKVKVFAVCR